MSDAQNESSTGPLRLDRAGIAFSVASSFFLAIAVPLVITSPINGSEFGVKSPKKALALTCACGIIPFFIVLFALILADTIGYSYFGSRERESAIASGVGFTGAVLGAICAVAAITMICTQTWKRYCIYWLIIALLVFWFLGMSCAGWAVSDFGMIAANLNFNAEAAFFYVVTLLWLMLILILFPINAPDDAHTTYETVK